MSMQRMDLTPQGHSFLNAAPAKKMAAISALLLFALIYQNFDFAESWKVNLLPLNEKARSAHARELLGKKYKGSSAQLVESANSLGLAIFNDVYKSLPKKYRNHAVDVSSVILQSAEKYEIDPVFIMAMIKTESSFNPQARGSHGEIGLMQLKPDTAEWIANKFHLRWKGPHTLEDPVSNVKIGMAYVHYLRDRFDGHANKYLSAYNMGQAKVCRMYADEQTPHIYSVRVMKNYGETYRRLAAATMLSLLAEN